MRYRLLLLVVLVSTIAFGGSDPGSNRVLVTQTDSIKSFNGAGAPNFPNGVTVNNVNGGLGILEGGSAAQFHTFFQGSDQAGDITYKLPTADGSAGQKLQTNGVGQLSWASGDAPAGTPNSAAIFDGTGALVASNTLFNDAGGPVLQMTTSGPGAGTVMFWPGSFVNPIFALDSGQFFDSLGALSIDFNGSRTLNGASGAPIMSWADAGVGVGTTTPSAKLDIVGAAKVTASGSDNALQINNSGSGFGLQMTSTGAGTAMQIITAGDGLQLNTSSGGGVPMTFASAPGVPAIVAYDGAFDAAYQIHIPNMSGVSVPWTFPAVQGAADSVLTNDGAGNLAWGDPPIAIGRPVRGGTYNNSILYVDGSGNLAADPNLTWSGKLVIGETGGNGGNVPHGCTTVVSSAGTTTASCAGGSIATGGGVNCGDTSLFISQDEFTGGPPATGRVGSCTSLLNVVTNTSIVVSVSCCQY